MVRLILLTILVIVVARLFWRVADGIIDGARVEPRRGRSPVKLVRDPVCGTYVAPTSALPLTAAGSTHYFCSEKCRDQYSRQRAAGGRS